MLIEKEWNAQAAIYSNQIKLYETKYENDKKLYEIELRKKEKDKAYLASLKVQKTEPAGITEREKKRLEDEHFQNQITKKVDEAEKIAREYELLIKKGRFDIECQYPEVIEIYSDILTLLKQKGWSDQVAIYNRQIKLYKEKLEQDKKLRKIEADKIRKQKEYEESLKMAKKVVPKSAGLNNSKVDKAAIKDELAIEVLKKEIATMVDKAIKLAREYEFAVRRGNTDIESPYPEVIEIYTKVRDMLLEKELYDQAEIYDKQIQFYKKKL